MNKTTFIYALKEVGTDEYRYVGKSNKPIKRLYFHLIESKKSKTHKERWIQSVLKRNSNIEYVILEEVSIDLWSEREIYWIARFKNDGYRLSNATDGGDCGPIIKGDFLPFSEARKIVQKLNFKNREEWKIYCNSGYKPNNIPKRPDEVYDEWIGLGDWLGTDRIANHKKIFLSYSYAKKEIHKLNIKTNKEWREFCKNNRPKNIPSNPDQYYRDKGWISWYDFLGN